MIAAARRRFWSKVDRGPGCWLWRGARDPNGYGRVSKRIYGESLAHRVSWTLSKGSHEGLFVLHKCDNPSCVNPGHLFLGTQKDNVLDMVRKKRGVRPPHYCGSRNNSAKLTERQVIEIRRLVATGETYTSVAEAFGTSRQNIRLIHRRIHWRHI